jgi:hypothetical protein
LLLTTHGHGGEDNKGREEDDRGSLFRDVSFNVVGRTEPVINIRVEQVSFMHSWQSQ